MERIKCYELKQIMHQNDEKIINILNWFQTTTQLQFDIDSISSQCFRTPPKDPKLPYLFYINEARFKHNESNLLQSDGNIYIFRAKNKHHVTCPKSFQLQNDPNFIIKLHLEIWVKKNMWVKLCVGNYSTHDGLLNGADGIFQASSKLPNSQEVMDFV